MTFRDVPPPEAASEPPSASTRLIIVNGLPGAGKSTLAAALARAWSAALHSKDDLKDVLAETTCPREPDPGWLSREAEDLLWFLTARRERVVVETWLGGADRAEAMLDRLRRCGIPASEVVEVWCAVPVDVARDRFLTRAREDASRHPRHLQAGADPTWWETLGDAGPLGIADVVRVDTTAPLDNREVRAVLRAALHRAVRPSTAHEPAGQPPSLPTRRRPAWASQPRSAASSTPPE